MEFPPNPERMDLHPEHGLHYGGPEQSRAMMSPLEEVQFKDWYGQIAEATGIGSNPDDPRHQYDYRAAYMARVYPEKSESGEYHWPSAFKLPEHPRLVLDGVNTKTGKRTQDGP